MKLYLSSFRLGDHPEHLVALLPPAARVAVSCNAIDAEDPAVRREKVADEIGRLTELGLRAEEFDLRTSADFTTYDGVWVRGGNVFVLRAAMARSGADQVLPGLIRTEKLVYAGYSAGPCVLAPSLRGLELCDDLTAVDGEVTFDGLGVLDQAIVPHLDSPGHPETELLAKVAALYERTGVPHLKMRDGQALVVNGDHRELV
ncbi:dipeptidase E [Kribbella sp. VKM Ac-2569]|uniref:Type 1 glutamine amidotransferase-like domain-containing protein n=1 Tax=Kribbella sp. VKM Ac-2569 TaxID=2512220 RepID=UPI00102C9237|nr:Type 1 glutamine amidotransferase-like domain-containing protein [Kribbella sp. VKM Ac-2569]RZT26630.1 dipeptidase E [Kribbella sp. VKM Ac-2569]